MSDKSYSMGTVHCHAASASCITIITFNLVSKYPNVLRSLFDILNKERDQRVRDNICAATCRMIMANIGGVPMDQVSVIFSKFQPSF